MKKSESELVLEAFLRPDGGYGEDRSPPPASPSLDELLLHGALGFGFADRDGFSNHFAGGGGSRTWSHNPTPKHSNISATIESQSSIYAGTPTSSHKPIAKVNQALGGTSGSEQSDEESFKIEGEPCEQSTNTIDTKRIRRMVSNRESARRSRKRKQAHIADLALQVDQLQGHHASLFKQLTYVNHEITDAVTNNRILKSNVEALRIKVKVAEDLVTEGALACSSIDHRLQSNAGSPQFLSPQQPCRASPDFLPTVEFQGDNFCYIGIPAAASFQNIGMENGDTKNADITSGLNQRSPLQTIASIENLHGSGTDIWTCEPNADTVPK